MDRGFLIRGAGAGLACLVPDRRARALVLAGSYVAGWFAGEHGIQVVSVTGFELPTSTVSWTATHLGTAEVLRRLPVPLPLAAAAYGAAVGWADQQVMAAMRSRLPAGEPTA